MTPKSEVSMRWYTHSDEVSLMWPGELSQPGGASGGVRSRLAEWWYKWSSQQEMKRWIEDKMKR